MDENLKRKGLLLSVGFAAGTAVAWLLTRPEIREPALPHAGEWQPVLADLYGEVDAGLLLARMQMRYRLLFANRPQFDHKALGMHLETSILPGVAAYEVLRDYTQDDHAALAAFDRLLQASIEASPLVTQMRVLEHLPRQFEIFRWVTRRAMAQTYPREGWLITWLEDSDDCMAFNVHRCFYIDVLSEYGVPELTPHFCRGDDLLFSKLPESIRWERTQTLGANGSCCDFAWRHVPLEELAVN